MKGIKRLFLIALALVFSLLAVACDNTSTYELKLDDKFNATVEMKVGDELTVTYSLTEGATLSWESSDNNVATISNAVLKAVGEGEATITVSVKEQKDLKATFKVNVTKDEEVTEYKLTLAGSASEVEVGNTITITPTLSPAVSGATFSWSVSGDNASVADGVVTGLKKGSATVTCSYTSADGKTVSATFDLEVTEPAAVEYTLTIEGPLTLELGASATYTPKLSPEITDASFVWSVDNSNASIRNGVLKGLKLGDVKITCVLDDDSLNPVTATLDVKVTNPKLTSVVLSGPTSVGVGETIKLEAALTPENAVVTATWTSSDDTIATVSDGVVTGVKEGTVKITYKADQADIENSVSSEYTITVTKPSPTSVTINEATSVLKIGAEINLTASVAPVGSNDSIVWSVDNEVMASIDQNGKFVAKAAGVVNVTAQSSDPNVKAVKAITIEADITDVKIFGYDTLYVGRNEYFKALVLSTQAAQDVVWTSSDDTVATINDAGLITPLKAGSVKFTATAAGTEIKAEIDVTVLDAINYTKTIIIDPSLTNVVDGTNIGYMESMFVYGTTVFKSLSDANLEANTRVYLASGDYGNYTLNVSNVRFEELEDNVATLTGVFTLADGVKNVTFYHLHQTGSGEFYGVDNNANITFDSCIFDASSVDASRGTVYFDKKVSNLKVLNCKFINTKAPRSVRCEGELNGLEVVNCIFQGTGNFDYIRTAKGFPTGYVNIRNNEFNTSSQAGVQFSVMGSVYLEVVGNKFYSMTNTAVDLRTTGGVKCNSLYNISYNIFDNTDMNVDNYWGCIRLRFNDFTDDTIKVNCNYNEFINWNDASMVNILNDATTNDDVFKLCDFSNNYFDYEVVDDDTFEGAAYKYNNISKADVEKAISIFNLDMTGDEVKLVGESDRYTKDKYATLASAIEASKSGDVIYLLPGTYNENVRIAINALTIRSLAYGGSGELTEVDPDAAIFTGKITLAKGLEDFTIDGIIFEGSAQIINEKGDDGTAQNTTTNLNGFNFLNNYVKSNMASGKGFVYFVEGSSGYSHNLVFSGNKFEGDTAFNAEALVYIDNCYDVMINDNVFVNIKSKAFYVNDTDKGLSGQYDAFVSNKFDNCGYGIYVNWLSALPLGSETAEVYFMNNSFNNIKEEAIHLGNMNNADKYVCIKVEYNKFEKVKTAIYFNRISSPANIDAWYNVFIDVPSSYYYVSAQNNTSYIGGLDAKYNTFLDGKGNIIEPDQSKFQINESDKGPLDISDAVDDLEFGYEFEEYATDILLMDDEDLYAGEAKEIEILFSPSGDVFYKGITYIIEDPSILQIENGMIIPLKSGTTKVVAIYDKNPAIRSDAVFVVKEYNVLELRYEGNGILNVNDTIQIECILDNAKEGATVEWNSSDNNIATVDSNGLVTAKGKGVVTITCKIKDVDVTATVGFSVVGDELNANALLKLLVEANNGVIMYEKIEYAGYESGYEHVPHYVYGSANKYFAGVLPTITPNMMSKSAQNIGWNEGHTDWEIHDEIKLVTVHDTGSAAPGSTAYQNSKWCTNLGNDNASWHYTIGNDGIYQQLEDKYVAWHAGDGSETITGLIDTGVTATEAGKRATVTIDGGYYVVNGTKTTCAAPKGPNGETLTTADIVDSGIVTIIGENNHYFIGTYYNKTYGKIASYGGYSSIAIETAVNKGSDVYLTWQYTAKFVASKLLEYNLTLDRMVYHNNLSGKNCPQTMREAHLTGMFEEMVAIEYEIQKNYKDYTITFTSSNPDVLDNTGRVVGNGPRATTQVNYTITVTKGNETASQECSVLVIGTRNAK